MRVLCALALVLAGCQEYDVRGGNKLPPADGPDIVVTPTALDFGELSFAQTGLLSFTVENAGNASLDVEGIELVLGAEAFTLLTPFEPTTLEIGATLSMDVQVTSLGDTHWGQAIVRLDDPDEPKVEVDMLARGIDGVDPNAVVEQWTVEEDPPVDILFAIDTSGSMSDDARALGNAFGSFIAEIGDVTSDWQIGVVTKDHGCFNQGIITELTPDYENVFDNAVSGANLFNTDLEEALLELTSVSLQQTAPGNCNDGFVRNGTLLHIVCVSDEPEQSGTPWDTWVAEYQSHMSDPNLLMISAVVDINGACGAPSTGYVEAATATGGALLDICNSNWGNNASVLGTASAAGLLSYVLAETPDPATIVVQADGVAYAGGWHYDAARNAVVIDIELAAGTVITISYLPL